MLTPMLRRTVSVSVQASARRPGSVHWISEGDSNPASQKPSAEQYGIESS